MRTVKEFYFDAFSAESLFGFRMIIAWASLLILLWCIGLSALVWRANRESYENKFMSVLLICEGVKASFIIASGTICHWSLVSILGVYHYYSWLITQVIHVAISFLILRRFVFKPNSDNSESEE